jgi:hypothetical protein
MHDCDVRTAWAATPQPESSKTELPHAVGQMRAAFDRALASHPWLARIEHYRFAGRPVRLRVVGRQLAERTHRAFAHLRHDPDPAGDAGWGLDLWDELETGVPNPMPTPGTEDRQWIACGGTLDASRDGRVVTFRYDESTTLLDRQAAQMISCRRSGAHLSTGELSKPFMLMLSIWLPDRGVQVLHAGLLARGGAAVLVPGPSGTGKSTTCLAAVSQGLDFLGDDFVGLERAGDGTFLGHSIFGTACLARNGVERFPDLALHAVDGGAGVEEKPILFLPEIYPDRLRATCGIRAIALVRIRQPRSEIQRAGRAEALREFAASTLHTVVPRPGREALAMIGELVERVPAYRLCLGPDLADIGPGLERILAIAGADVT